MERIVVGIDTEAASQVAVDWVIHHARHVAAEITVVKAFDMFLDAPRDDGALLERTKSRIEEGAPSATVSTALVDSSIMEALVSQSASADLVVVGYHRRRPVLSALSGALPARFAARSHCATVVVPEDWDPRDGAVVLGIGDDDVTDRGIDFAVRAALHPRRPLRVVHAWQLPIPSWDALGALVASADDLRDAHRDLLADRVRGIREAHPGLEIDEVLTEGPSAAALLAASEDAELVVLGTHRRGPISGLMLGSTLLELMPLSRVPICIVPLVAPLAPVGGTVAPAV